MKKLLHSILSRRARALVDRVSPFLPESGTILDIGCGTGHNALEIRRRFDRDVCEVDVANMKAVGPPPTLFDGRHLPFNDGQFTCGLAFFILHYADDLPALLNEIRRVVAGPLIILQSTYEGAAAHAALAMRDLFQGRLAFHLAAISGFVPKGRSCMRPRQFMSRPKLLAMFEQARWSVASHRPEERYGLKLSRDLYVLVPK